MFDSLSNYNSIVVDIGSGYTKAGFTGEDGPRCVFPSLVGMPRNPGILVGMEQKEYYVGEESLSKMDIMNFYTPVENGEIKDWNKFETLLHYLFFSELKIVPEEISILITESPLNDSKNRERLAETLFETFNIQNLHIANSSMLGLYSYGLSSGLVIDSGFGQTSCVPVYEGYPLPHASTKCYFAGKELSDILLNMLYSQINSVSSNYGNLLTNQSNKSLVNLNDNNNENLNKMYADNIKNMKVSKSFNGLGSSFSKPIDCKVIKSRLLADKIKESYGLLVKNIEEEEDSVYNILLKYNINKGSDLIVNSENENNDLYYELPDKNKIRLSSELYKHAESIYKPNLNDNPSILQLINESLSKCDSDIIEEIQENICLIGGTTLYNGYFERLELELSQRKENNSFRLNSSAERQYSSWIGGSIVSSLSNFNSMWVSRQNYDEAGSILDAVESKCF